MTQLRSDTRSMPVRDDVRDGTGRLTRNRSLTTDKFHINPRLMSPELSYEWKRLENMGMRDVEHQVMLAENHWRAVDSKEMPGMMPAGHNGPVVRGGSVLMCRPSYLTDEANEEVRQLSNAQVRTNEQRLGLSEQGHAPRVRPQVSRDYTPVSAADRASVRTIPD